MQDQTLPSREQAHFRSIVKFYEAKHYKKGVKAADMVLKKFPNHGETQAMKGLVLNCMDKKPEAYDLVKLGLRNNMRSHVCWHVYGLLYRSDRKYADAVKCYRNALRIDTENQQIMRDLAQLQVQMRDVSGFVVTRRSLLGAKCNNKNNWVALAVAQHLNGDLAQAVKILDTYLATEEKDQRVTYESSELLMYRNQLLVEAGEDEVALAHLDEISALVLDKLSWRLTRARLLVRLQRFEEAEAAFMALLRVNAENYEYHCGLQCARLRTAAHLELRGCETPASAVELSEEQVAALQELYATLAEQHPRSFSTKRIPLSFCRGDGLREPLDAYIKMGVRRGVPSLASDLKELYCAIGSRTVEPHLAAASAKAQLVGELVGGYVEALRSTCRFPGAAADSAAEVPTVLFWALCLLAQHFYRLGDFQRALELVSEAADHTPTAIDAIQLKGKIIKRCGDVAAASAAIDGARKLDLQDRYINNKATKYMLRNGQLTEAETTIGMFTRQEGDMAVAQSLFEMQCSWYELECGAAHFRAGAIGKALKNFVAVEKHFLDFCEDQFDFHGYCLRKVTLRAYVQLLRMQDKLRGHHLFCRAARAAIRCYLVLADKPDPAAVAAQLEVDYAAMTPAARKKAKAAARKQAALEREAVAIREQESEAAAAATAAAAAAKDDGDKKKTNRRKDVPVDDDPNGEKLAALEPLGEAWRLVLQLIDQAADDVETHVLAVDVALRRKKFMLALRALNKARKIAPEHPDTLLCTISFCKETAAQEAAPGAVGHETVGAVVKQQRDAMLGGRSTLEMIDAFAAAHAGSLPHRVGAAQALAVVDGEAHAARIAELLSDVSGVGVTVEACTANHGLLCKLLKGSDQPEAYKALCAPLFPLSTFFGAGVGVTDAPADAGGE